MSPVSSAEIERADPTAVILEVLGEGRDEGVVPRGEGGDPTRRVMAAGER